MRASFAKAYEFNALLYRRRWESEAFFVVSTLRGITEDLIVLRFLSGLPAVDREELVFSLVMWETHSRLTTQAAFFQSCRPYHSSQSNLEFSTSK